jgi:hypothetical protein
MQGMGISKDDIKEALAPIIKEVVQNELRGALQDVIKQETKATMESVPGLVNTYVAEHIKGIAGEIKAEASEQLARLSEAASGNFENPAASAQVAEAGTSMVGNKAMNTFVDALISKILKSDDEDSLLQAVEKIKKRKQAEAELAQAFGFYQPGPEILWRAYSDATAKAYAAMMKSGHLPFPVVDETVKKNSSLLSRQGESKSNTSRQSPGIFDRFLK